MADVFDPSPRRTRSRSRIASDNADHPGRRTRSRTVSRPSLHDIQPDPDMHILKSMHVQETFTLVEKRPRHKMTDYQLRRLEELYRADTHPTRSAKEALASEVGMNVKSVLIWFQNRRQDRSRKAKTIATPPLTRSVRPSPLEAKPIKHSKYASPLSRNAAARAKVAAAKGKAFLPVSSRVAPSSQETTLVTPPTVYRSTPLKDAYSRQNQPQSRPRRSASPDTPRSEKRSPDLWKHLPPTPPSRGRKSAQRPSSSPTRRESPPKPLADASNLPQRGRPEKPSLEWACANSAARRKHGLAIYRDEDDSAGESTDIEDELVMTHWIPAKSSYGSSGAFAPGKDADKKLKPPTERRLYREVAIPQEYHALFPPDLVLGASLLLALKHSADPDDSI